MATTRSRIRSFARKIFSVVFLRFFILVVCLVLTLYNLAYAVQTLRSQYRSKYTTETSVLLALTTADLSIEPWFAYNNTDSTVAHAVVDEAVEKLRSRTNLYGLSMDSLVQLINEGRANATKKSYLQSIDAYTKANMLLMGALRLANTQQIDNLAAVQTGVICLLTQVTPIFTHNSLMLSYFLDNFSTSVYETFLGNAFTTTINANCSAYSSQLDPKTLYSMLSNGPQLVAQPTIWLSNATAVVDNSSFLTSMQWFRQSISTNGDYIVGCWKSHIRYYTSVVALLSLACVIFCVATVGLPFIMMKKKTSTGPTVQQKYKRIEGLIKLVTQHVQTVTTLKTDNKWQALVADTFLYKINTFITRARPCIPQTCFGDVEVVTMGSMPRNDGLNWEDGDDMTAIDENGVQDLRLGIGLRPVYGTFLCVSAQVNELESFEKSDKLGTARQGFCMRMSNLVSHIESVANAHRGSVHTIAGDLIIITWNVVSSCRTSEANALHTALDIIFSTHLRQTYSIAIVNGAVLAGTVEDGEQRHPIICGPAIRRCQRLIMINALQRTSLVLDQNVTARLTSSSVPGYTYTIVPVCMYGFVTDVTGPRTVYAVFSAHMNDFFREWNVSFTDFQAAMKKRSYARLLTQLEQYARDRPLKSKQQEKQLGLLPMDIAQIVAFWIATVKSLVQDAATSHVLEQKNKRLF